MLGPKDPFTLESLFPAPRVLGPGAWAKSW